MKSFTSIVGWLLLAALISVPSFLFYNWWAGTKNSETSVAFQQSDPGDRPAPVFAGREKSSRAGAPGDGALRGQAPAKDLQGQAAAGGPQAGMPVVVTTAAAAAAQAPAKAGLPAALLPTQAGVSVSSAQPAGAAAQVAVSTRSGAASYFNPRTDRDPVMSPGDYQKIRDEEQRRLEEERLARLAAMIKKKVPGPETRLNLQGIVGNRVIINGEMYSLGNTVAGVKILRIGSDYIICEYRGKKFKKILQ